MDMIKRIILCGLSLLIVFVSFSNQGKVTFLAKRFYPSKLFFEVSIFLLRYSV